MQSIGQGINRSSGVTPAGISGRGRRKKKPIRIASSSPFRQFSAYLDIQSLFKISGIQKQCLLHLVLTVITTYLTA